MIATRATEETVVALVVGEPVRAIAAPEHVVAAVIMDHVMVWASTHDVGAATPVDRVAPGAADHQIIAGDWASVVRSGSGLVAVKSVAATAADVDILPVVAPYVVIARSASEDVIARKPVHAVFSGAAGQQVVPRGAADRVVPVIPNLGFGKSHVRAERCETNEKRDCDAPCQAHARRLEQLQGPHSDPRVIRVTPAADEEEQPRRVDVRSRVRPPLVEGEDQSKTNESADRDAESLLQRARILIRVPRENRDQDSGNERADCCRNDEVLHCPVANSLGARS